jgi:A/G-specific adenine glycosylase
MTKSLRMTARTKTHADDPLPEIEALIRDQKLKGSEGLKDNQETTNDDGLKSEHIPLLVSWMNHKDVRFHCFSDEEAEQIRSRLLYWYRQNRRKLPWRGDPPPWNGSTAMSKKSSPGSGNLKEIEPQVQQIYKVSPYGIWVSEVMLQQTRVEAVIGKWCLWMTRFPTVQDLSNASLEDINAIWAGLGYYRRAQLLHKAAQVIVTQHNGIIPSNVKELMQLPGIGRYTAGAIASIAYGQSVPVVDGNVCRVLSRLRGIAQTIKAVNMKDKYAWDLAEQIVTAGSGAYAGEVNQAIMELGATYCAPSGTGIDPNDPLVHFYWSTKLGHEMYQCCTLKGTRTDTTSLFDLFQERPVSSEDCCPLCDSNGIADVLTQFQSVFLSDLPSASLNGCDLVGDDEKRAQRMCHNLFPLAPPKLNKKEDLYAIAAIHNSCANKWLLVKRPNDNGLLSGQWEFPSYCVWRSEANTSLGQRRTGARPDMSQKVPSISVAKRRKYLHGMLKDRLVDEEFLTKLSDFASVNDAPIHHVFSHVRHTMYIEYAFTESVDSNVFHGSSDSGTQLQWMSLSDMKEVGITSGVQKILTAVLDFQKNKNPNPKKKRRTK